MPIIIIYFLLNRLNFTEIGILTATIAIIHVSLEVHGGVFADLKGNRLSLMIHSVFAALCMLFYLIGDSFWYFFVASVCYGVSGAFISGSRNALMFETLQKLKRTSEFKKFNGRMLLISHLVNAVVLLLIPFVFDYNPKYPFVIGIGFFIGSFIVAALFVEPRKTVKKSSSKEFNKNIIKSLKIVANEREIFSVILLTTVIAAFTHVGANYIQPLLTIAGLPVIYFGVVYALMRAAMGLGAALTHRLERWFSAESIILLVIFLMSAAFAGYLLGFGLIIPFCVLLINLAFGLNRIVLEDKLNQSVKSNRTTILSISSLIQTLFRAVLIFFSGILADYFGVQGLFFFVLIGFLVFAFAAVRYSRKVYI
ncbi:MFS transporter [Candidatus Woesearchaeota archaeon]|nr:MFS transporter [Candidatus Woesearchaeota archaeon]